MAKKFNTVLFIFRRDLRLEDNTALIAALQNAHIVVPLFIFDEAQVTEVNKYRSKNALLFMMQSLAALAHALEKHGGKLYLFYGNPAEVIKKLFATLNIDALFVNRDYTPFSQKRDATLAALCKKYNVIFEPYNDILLQEPQDVTTGNLQPYRVFTPFFKKALTLLVREPITTFFPHVALYHQHITNTVTHQQLSTILDGYENHELYTTGSPVSAHALLIQLTEQKNYIHTHDIPNLHTSKLSAHLKFGTVSVRAVFYAIQTTLGKHHPLLRQLYWRDFFTHTLFHFPHMLQGPLQEKYGALPWQNDKKRFAHWCTGTTGFPIVDAGMRQLNTTGFMHNRVRMIVASFLVKDLHIDWRWGERYFAQHLVDYDPAVNNGNWQWCASTGFDAQPYFRIFNHWLQQKKFDPDCRYIKQWIPELNAISSEIIHQWHTHHTSNINYPAPLINHTEETALTKKAYALCKLNKIG